MKLPKGVIVNKTIADRVRFHHAIFVDKIVLASIARTNGALSTQTRTILFGNDNKFCHVVQESQIVASPRYLVHPLSPIHEGDLAHSEKLESNIRRSRSI